MFWSKIWFFLIALAAAVALTIALVMPRPAQRTLADGERNRLSVACGALDVTLASDARIRVDLAGAFARKPEIIGALEAASAADKLDEARMKQVRSVTEAVMKEVQGGRKPDFAILVDRRGRAVARARLDETDFGDVVAGRPLVDDALAGYLRDDIWAQNGTMYFVSAAPVIKTDGGVAYVGAVVLGHQVTNDLAKKLVSTLDVDMGFYLGADDVAGSKSLAVDHAPMQAAIGKLSGGDFMSDCRANEPIAVRAGTEEYTAVVARLPGEAGARQAYFSVIIKRPESIGFTGTLNTVRRGDLSFANFPWIVVAGAFLLALALGIGLMFIEADRPLRRLTADAVRLAKGETERLAEDAHAGKFGSIARSVNIAIDKLGRDAKAAKQDLDQLLGPAPEGSLGTIDLLATALPPARPGGPASGVPVPPSEFRFGDSGPQQARAMPQQAPARPPPRAPTPPPGVPVPSHTPQPMPAMRAPMQPMPQPVPNAQTQPLTLDDDILDRPTEPPVSRVDPYFKSVFDQFIATKRSCGESVTALTVEKFVEKLVRNRDDLIAKTGCREVRFTVYVKDGKAALKATPVKDE